VILDIIQGFAAARALVAALFSSSKDPFLLYSLKGNFLKLMRKASRGVVYELV